MTNIIECYDRTSVLNYWKLYFSTFSTSYMRRVSGKHRLKDYRWLFSHPEYLLLHKKFTEHVIDGAKRWDGYDYGEGYFYQQCKLLGVTGFRDTEARVAEMDLNKYLAGKTALEIGCNTGFISITAMKAPGKYVAPKSITAFDIAPYLIDIAKDATEFLKLENLDFQCTSFEEFRSDEKFDVILSFANHSTFDGKTKQSIDDYFARCFEFCSDDGRMIFESHHPNYEKDLDEVLKVIEKYFIKENKKKISSGGYYDIGRTVIVYRKK